MSVKNQPLVASLGEGDGAAAELAAGDGEGEGDGDGEAVSPAEGDAVGEGSVAEDEGALHARFLERTRRLACLLPFPTIIDRRVRLTLRSPS